MRALRGGKLWVLSVICGASLAVAAAAGGAKKAEVPVERLPAALDAQHCCRC